ncbi:WAT1-related protein At1g68170-like [Mangifera indica]|uniref:WAT1-related protein At1g68170-like n=1 Tax=Mangifera indica TaxID=29780 RepID=UPI001CF945D4|nr:WAT1-related protein At1g68170-like [Mangifera indica]
MMNDICSFINELKPVLVMVAVQVVYAGGTIFYKLAVIDGMNSSIIVAYRFIISTAIMLPFAFFVERKKRPKLNLKILFQAFLGSLLGCTLHQLLYLESMALTSATFVTAMLNLIPAITYILALSFRLEKVAGIWTPAGKAKVVGTLMGIVGAMVLTFCKGVEIKIWSTNINLLHQNAPQAHHSESTIKTLFGCLMSVGGCFLIGIWLIIQAKMSEQYPCQHSITALVSLMAAMESVVFALCKEKDLSQWKLGFNIRLLTVAYVGTLSAGFVMSLTFWCVQKKGPFFVSVFGPLMLVVVAFVASLILGESLHLGSILGAILIICGLYAVLWGKAKETKKITQLMPLKDSGESQSTEIVINSLTENTSNDIKN